MLFPSWLQNHRSALLPGRGQRHHRRRGSLRAVTHRLTLEALEDRCLLSFSPVVNYHVGANPKAMLAADFNGDTVQDLAVVNNYGDSVSVLLGNGDGTFQPDRESFAGYYPRSLAVGDFNSDGKLDLATANTGYDDDYSFHHNDVSILLGNGDGTFQQPASFGVGVAQAPTSLAVGDFNGDGTLDLGVTTDYHFYYGESGFADVLLGNGDGNFSGPNSTYLGPGFFYSAVAANVNGDAFEDFVAVSAGQVKVLLADSSGFLHVSSLVYTSYYSSSVAAGDVNADGHTDLVTASYADSNVSVRLGNGSGGFNAVGNYATGAHPAAVVLGDFNGDGWLDAATANDGDNVSVLINDQSWPPANVPSVSINDVTVTEGNTGTVNATFTLTLSAASNVDVTAHYATADGTATVGSDYTATSGTVTIPAGQTTRTIAVAVKGDRLPEPSETFAVNLSTPTNATIADAQAICTILDNEPRISISDVAIKEGKQNQTTQFTFIVTLSATYDQPVTMSFQTVNGTATTNDNDYVGKTGTLTFKPGETSKTITIVVNGDSKKEANETFYLDLFGNSSNSLFKKSRGIGTILNDD
jgi:Calx-beta domain/FG-GAP-like repeat